MRSKAEQAKQSGKKVQAPITIKCVIFKS